MSLLLGESHSFPDRRFTATAVANLLRSRSLALYRKHIIYHENILVVSWLGLFYLFLIIYIDICANFLFDSYAPNILGAFLSLNRIPYIFVLICLIFSLLLGAPSAILGPFIGYFEAPVSSSWFSLALAYNFVNILYVYAFKIDSLNLTSHSYFSAFEIFARNKLGNYDFLFSLHSPLSPPQSILSVSKWLYFLKELCIQIFPLQGPLIAGLIVIHWRERFWEKSHYIPFPILFIPLLCGLCTTIWWRVSTITLLFIKSLPSANTFSIFSYRTLQDFLLFATQLLEENIVGLKTWFPITQTTPVQTPGNSHENLIIESLTRLWIHLWAFTIGYLVVSLICLPLLRRGSLILSFFFPTSPTSWLLVLFVIGSLILSFWIANSLFTISGIFLISCFMFFLVKGYQEE